MSDLSVKGLFGALASPAGRGRILTLLKPMENGPQEIRSLDGLRALAALSIVLFHVMLFLQLEYQPWSQAINHGWYYLSTGVHLFFVLSGFLLFLPYVRALLDGERLPSARRFYRRRALSGGRANSSFRCSRVQRIRRCCFRLSGAGIPSAGSSRRRRCASSA